MQWYAMACDVMQYRWHAMPCDVMWRDEVRGVMQYDVVSEITWDIQECMAEWVTRLTPCAGQHELV